MLGQKASEDEVKEFVAKGLSAEDKRERVAILVLLVAILLIALAGGAHIAHAGGQPTLSVAGTRTKLELTMDQQPITNVVNYYMGNANLLTTTVGWVNISNTWTTAVQNTKGWTAFKIEQSTLNISNPFWAKPENDDTGWVTRSVFTPTLTVTGNNQITLTAWGIWGDESLETWRLGQHSVFTLDWAKVTSDTYQIQLSGVGSWASFKVQTWPDLQLISNNPYWVAGASPGWVVHIPMPWRLFLPAIFR